MRKINKIIIHCAATPNGKHFTIEDIDSWHKERGFNRDRNAVLNFNPHLSHIGYHYVIYVDGSVHAGRNEDEIGAHAQGYNSNSIGICLIGTDMFTDAQYRSLECLLRLKLIDYPKAEIIGHYAVDKHGKTCPNIDIPAYLASDYLPPLEKVIFA